MSQENDTNEVKKYSDMRYELNKLSVLSHNFIVEFVGVVARPPSFVLEWAPLMSLEKIRVRHERQQSPICPVSLYITLLQVSHDTCTCKCTRVGKMFVFFYYASSFRKTKRAMTLIFVIQLTYIQTYILAKYIL